MDFDGKETCYCTFEFWSCNAKKKEAPELIENLTFWTVARMVDRRPRMRRSHRNATVLLFTSLIRRSDGSHVSNWILVVGYLGFSYKQPVTQLFPPIIFSCRLFSFPYAASARFPVRCPCASPVEGSTVVRLAFGTPREERYYSLAVSLGWLLIDFYEACNILVGLGLTIWANQS
jgi:hypothetical protein